MPSIHSKGAGIKKILYTRLLDKKASLIFLFSFIVFPGLAQTGFEQPGETLRSPEEGVYNSQNVALLSSKFRADLKGPIGGADGIIVEGDALVANVSPVADVESEKIISAAERDISVYTVRDGDSIGSIAEMFDISPNTIRWANNISLKGTIKEGDTIIILPINGIKYTVRSGVTVEKIAKDFGGDVGEILIFNGLEEGADLIVGSTLIIPSGEIEDKDPVKMAAKTTTKSNTDKGYYSRPVAGIESRQHTANHHGVDIAAKTGTPIKAMADGTVMVVKGGNGWHGGYGNLTIIGHENGTQTLYAHQSRIDVKQGQKVTKGQVIGAVGNTGRSTGPHLHFEIRPGKSGINGRAIADGMY